MSRIVTRSLIATIAVLVLYVLVAATLVMSPAPTFTRTQIGSGARALSLDTHAVCCTKDFRF